MRHSLLLLRQALTKRPDHVPGGGRAVEALPHRQRHVVHAQGRAFFVVRPQSPRAAGSADNRGQNRRPWGNPSATCEPHRAWHPRVPAPATRRSTGTRRRRSRCRLPRAKGRPARWPRAALRMKYPARGRSGGARPSSAGVRRHRARHPPNRHGRVHVPAPERHHRRTTRRRAGTHSVPRRCALHVRRRRCHRTRTRSQGKWTK